jgi:hypothetical protein
MGFFRNSHMNIAIELATTLNIIRTGIRNEMGALMKRAILQAIGSVHWEDGTETTSHPIEANLLGTKQKSLDSIPAFAFPSLGWRS